MEKQFHVLRIYRLIDSFICCSNKLSIHIEYLTLRVHQKFTIISLNLNSSHNHIIFHVNTNLFSLIWLTITVINNIFLLVIDCVLISLIIIEFAYHIILWSSIRRLRLWCLASSCRCLELLIISVVKLLLILVNFLLIIICVLWHVYYTLSL